MPNYMAYPEVEDDFVMSQNEENQEKISPFEQNPAQLDKNHNLTDYELENDQEHIISEDDENNYYILPENAQNDSKLLIILIIGTLISLGILANSILT